MPTTMLNCASGRASCLGGDELHGERFRSKDKLVRQQGDHCPHGATRVGRVAEVVRAAYACTKLHTEEGHDGSGQMACRCVPVVSRGASAMCESHRCVQRLPKSTSIACGVGHGADELCLRSAFDVGQECDRRMRASWRSGAKMRAWGCISSDLTQCRWSWSTKGMPGWCLLAGRRGPQLFSVGPRGVRRTAVGDGDVGVETVKIARSDLHCAMAHPSVSRRIRCTCMALGGVHVS